MKGNEDLKVVTFTRRAQSGPGSRRRRCGGEGGRKVVPYAALIYDPEGKTFVYTSPKRLTYLRAPVKVDTDRGPTA